MPSVPLRLALVGACALAIVAPAQAKKDPLPGASGTTPAAQSVGPDSNTPDEGKKSPYSGQVTPTGSSAPQASPVNSGSASSQTVVKRTAVKVDRGKKSPYTGVSQAASVTTTATAGAPTPPPAAAPVTPTPVATTPVRQRTTSRHKSSRRRGTAKRAGTPSTAARSIVRPVRPVTVARTAPARKPATKRQTTGHQHAQREARPTSVVTRTVHDIVRVIPAPLKALLAGMGVLLLATIAGWTLVTIRARRLNRQRRELLTEVGLLQAALLPEVPDRVGPLAVSVAYRPADGPAAGGDFYDVFEMEDGRVGIVLGDVAGHGRDALARTALLRYTLRAYLDTGLEPRTALRLAGETLEHNMSSFATAVVATFDPQTSTLTYSCAGHPPPILLGPVGHAPVTACAAPPIGVGTPTGQRQTTEVLPAGTVVCFFTDGLAEARLHGTLLGRGRLLSLLRDLGPEATAPELIQRVRRDVHHTPDDMAACVLRPLVSPADLDVTRTEELELREGGEDVLRRFLEACDVPAEQIDLLIRDSGARAEDYGEAVVRVKLGDAKPQVSVVLPMIETLTAARR